jgi:2,3-bisphosphoglycerate-independent phosphoglycerate mutase
MLRKLIYTANETNTILLVTADHGNCDEMFDVKQHECEDWESIDAQLRPKTSHTLSPVPFYLHDPEGVSRYHMQQGLAFTLANIANTVLVLLGVGPCNLYHPSIVIKGA